MNPGDRGSAAAPVSRTSCKVKDKMTRGRCWSLASLPPLPSALGPSALGLFLGLALIPLLSFTSAPISPCPLLSAQILFISHLPGLWIFLSLCRPPPCPFTHACRLSHPWWQTAGGTPECFYSWPEWQRL